jgi:signal peptidase I
MDSNVSEKSSGVTKKKMTGFTKFRKDWIEPIIIALILVFFIKTFFIQNFKIPSSSMEDTLLIGDHLFAVRFLYGTKIPLTKINILKIRNPKPGDVIVFKYPEDPSKDFIKRCVAIEGQTVEIKNKKVYVDGKLQELPKHAKFIDNAILPIDFGVRDNFPATKVSPKNLFAMGDNRDNSNDSRFWGFVPYENIKGKALFIYWSIDPDVPVYDVIHKIRWGRMFNLIK